MFKLHEYQAKQVFADAGVPTPESKLASDVDLSEVAEMTEGMSGADLKAIRNAAGMKALTRAARGGDAGEAAVAQEDFVAALAERGVVLTPD